MPGIYKFGWSEKIAVIPEIYTSMVPTEAPKLQFDEVFSPNMGLQGLHNLLHDPGSPQQQQNGFLTDGATNTPPCASNHPTTPLRLPQVNSRRNFSQQSEADGPQTSCHVPSPQGTLGADNNEMQWSSAVGRATTGKSGRVIERLMAENDRLQREMNLALVRLDEETKRSDSARSALEALRSTNENLVAMHELDSSILIKRERRVEEMKNELDSERRRRERADQEAKEARRERDEVVDRLKREAIMERENSRRVSAQYDALMHSFKRLEDGYGRQTRKIKADVKHFQSDVAADKQKLAGLRTITDQIRSESEKSQNCQEQLVKRFDAYKTESELFLKGVKEGAERNDDANDRMQEEMQTVLGKMKYIIGVKETFRAGD
ncbi:MAG: hypothetical protein Q9190_001551 [Brigantiaea leucoxantha]